MERIVQGDRFAWRCFSGEDWARLKASQGRNVSGAVLQCSVRYVAMRMSMPFSVAQGIVCSDLIQRTQAQGVIDWHAAQTDPYDRCPGTPCSDLSVDRAGQR